MKISFETAKMMEPKAIESLEGIAQSFSDIMGNGKIMSFYSNENNLHVIVNGDPMIKLTWKRCTASWIIDWMC